MSQKKPSRDWNAERAELAAAITQLEMMKLWLMEHQQSAPALAKELEKLNARLSRFGEIDEEGMVEFRLGINRERWGQFTQACNAHTGRELTKSEVETRAFSIWNNAIDAIIKHYKQHEEDRALVRYIDPAVTTSWEHEMVSPWPRRPLGDDDRPAMVWQTKSHLIYCDSLSLLLPPSLSLLLPPSLSLLLPPSLSLTFCIS